MKTWTVTSVADLEAVAMELAEALSQAAATQAAVLALHGNLGAGKTTFVQLLAKHLIVTDTVNSPTFVIEKQYQTELGYHLVHIDAYRIESDDELRVLGFTELVAQPRTIIAVEWAEKVAALLPAHTTHLTFDVVGDTRTLTLTP